MPLNLSRPIALWQIDLFGFANPWIRQKAAVADDDRQTQPFIHTQMRHLPNSAERLRVISLPRRVGRRRRRTNDPTDNFAVCGGGGRTEDQSECSTGCLNHVKAKGPMSQGNQMQTNTTVQLLEILYMCMGSWEPSRYKPYGLMSHFIL